MNTIANAKLEQNLIPLNEPAAGIPDITHTNISAAIQRLKAESGPFAVDSERAGGIRYTNRAYLIQIKRGNGEIFLIDPVGIESEFSNLAKIMCDEWILHSASQDLPCLAELGLVPRKIFDTEIAALLLGLKRNSLQGVVAEILGISLAKEYSAADWSMRPIPSQMRAYAALDVELLYQLKQELTKRLNQIGRYEWFLQECDEILNRKPPAPKAQPWRKIANRLTIQDRRALAMLENMWWAREEIAQQEDIAPSKLINSAILGELARRKPRSQADLLHSPLLRRNSLHSFGKIFWPAIETAWKTNLEDLPPRTAPKSPKPFPPVHTWENQNIAAFQRWKKIRKNILEHAGKLNIPQEILLKPKLQKRIAWEGWNSGAQFAQKLSAWGARPWQIEQCAPLILEAADTSQESARAS